MEGEVGHDFFWAGAMVICFKVKAKLYYLMYWGLAIFLMVWMRLVREMVRNRISVEREIVSEYLRKFFVKKSKNV